MAGLGCLWSLKQTRKDNNGKQVIRYRRSQRTEERQGVNFKFTMSHQAPRLMSLNILSPPGDAALEAAKPLEVGC